MVFVLLHCFGHFLGHGVGLRHVMDYYYVLEHQGEDKERGVARKWLCRLHLTKFASAMMWVMKEVFLLEDKKLLTEPDEEKGRFLLEEIWQTGNMGHYDKRHWGSLRTPLSRFVYNLRRDLHFVRHYPQEVLWQPLFNIYQFVMQKVIWR